MYLIGIDEAGRGPLAGPVAVGAAAVPQNFDWSLVQGAKDSKQMSEKAREQVYATILTLRDARTLNFAVAFSSSTMIDRYGIVPSIKSALARALAAVAEGDGHEIRLDGGLRAPEQYKHQTTIIRGDQSEPIISLASIAAKVERDRLMKKLAQKFPAYEFEKHKGYGTALHRAAIKKSGLSEIHRRSFCRALISTELSV